MTAAGTTDRTYTRVLRALDQRPGGSYRSIARKLKVAPSTVGMAVERGIREGVLERAACGCCGSTMLRRVNEPKEAVG